MPACPAIHDSIIQFHKNALAKFINNIEQAFDGRLPVQFLEEWNSSPFTKLSSSNSNTSISFEWLIKGFIPTSLPKLIGTLFPKAVANELILVSLGHISLMFFKDIWCLRCKEFTLIEKSLNITSK